MVNLRSIAKNDLAKISSVYIEAREMLVYGSTESVSMNQWTDEQRESESEEARLDKFAKLLLEQSGIVPLQEHGITSDVKMLMVWRAEELLINLAANVKQMLNQRVADHGMLSQEAKFVLSRVYLEDVGIDSLNKEELEYSCGKIAMCLNLLMRVANQLQNVRAVSGICPSCERKGSLRVNTDSNVREEWYLYCSRDDCANEWPYSDWSDLNINDF